MSRSIEVERVSKRFVLNQQRPADLRERFSRRFRSGSGGPQEFWALQDISFAVEKGTSLGIVGHNGSGKSTMLKLLTGIFKPTTGSVRVRGRVGALIEVGAGFHPDLTGRENVYLNGSILGLSRREIAQKYDAIVDFAGLERFMETPVKRYSTGMYMRLGFSIAAHVDPDILVIDEVLAVGDQQFQNKCLRRMREFIAQGGTVVFVSHAMEQVAQLCEQCVWLDHGRVLYHGDTREAVDRYLALVADREDEEFRRNHPEEWAMREEERRQEEERILREAERLRTEDERLRNERLAPVREWPNPETAPGNGIVRLRSVRVRREDGRTVAAIDIREPVGVEMTFDVLRPGHVLVPNLHLQTPDGACVFVAADHHDPDWKRLPRPTGHYVSTAWIPGNFLADGTLIVGAAVSTMNPVTIHAHEPEAVAFQVVDSFDGDAARGDFAGPIPGVVRPLLRWTTRTGSESDRPLAPPVREVVS